MRTHLLLLPAMLIGAAALHAARPQIPTDVPFTDQFNMDDCDKFVPKSSIRYFPLQSGAFRRFEGEDDGQQMVLEVTVLNQTKMISLNVDGHTKTVKTRVVEEREWVDGELAEVSLNYYARCPKTGNIYYFGEHVDHYEDGTIVDH